eukprot:30137-Amphidinium_carterae.1
MDASKPSLREQVAALTSAGVEVQNSIFNTKKPKEASDKAIIMHSLLWLYDSTGHEPTIMFVTADTDYTVLLSQLKQRIEGVCLITPFGKGDSLRRVATPHVIDWETLMPEKEAAGILSEPGNPNKHSSSSLEFFRTN